MKRRTAEPQDLDAGYMRVSEVRELEGETFDQAVERLIEIRATELREASARHGREIPDSRLYVDMDITGTSVAKRPDMQDLLEAARRGEFARLWVKNLSRLFRNLEEQIAYIQLIEAAGVRIISLQEPSEGEKPLLDLTRNMLGAVNQYLAAATGQQIKANNRIIASTGRLPGGQAPLGYIYDRITKELAPDPARRADAIAVFQTYAEIGTYIRTAERLNLLGIRTRTGHAWRHDKVKLLVNNPIYRGQVHYCGETWPGRHELIIPEDLLEAVDRRIEAGRHTWSMAPRSGAIRTSRTFSGLLICGLCGDRMRAKPSRWADKDYCYWTCSNHQDRRLCDLPHYRTEELEHFVREGIKLALGHELEALQAYARDRRPSKPAPAKRAQSGRGSIEAKMLRLATEYAEGHLPQAQYRILMNRYQQIRELESAESEEPAERQEITAERIERFRADLDEGWANAHESDRRTVIQSIAPRIVVYPDTLLLHTILSIGTITIPTMMFERPARVEPCPAAVDHLDADRARPRHDPTRNLGESAPDRNRTCASGSGGLRSIR